MTTVLSPATEGHKPGLTTVSSVLLGLSPYNTGASNYLSGYSMATGGSGPNVATTTELEEGVDGGGKKSKRSPSPVDSEYVLVEDESQIQPALSKLRETRDHPSPIAVDCEGDKLSRDGILSIVSVATENRIFLFDIKKLGAQVFDEGLKEILEDPEREKLMFDCRADSDCLWHKYRVKLANVIDVQLMQVIYRETNPEPETRKKNDQPRIRGLLFCLKLYTKDDDLIRAKENGATLMDRWMERPLSQKQLKYAAADVKAFFTIYDKLKTCVESSSAKARLRQASQRYLGFYRDRLVRSHDDYERNSFLPWRLVPEYAGSSYVEQVECVGCKRRFPRSDFSKNQLRQGTQKCPVCKKVKEALDIEKNRAAQFDRYDYADETYYSSSDEDYL